MHEYRTVDSFIESPWMAAMDCYRCGHVNTAAWCLLSYRQARCRCIERIDRPINHYILLFNVITQPTMSSHECLLSTRLL